MTWLSKGSIGACCRLSGRLPLNSISGACRRGNSEPPASLPPSHPPAPSFTPPSLPPSSLPLSSPLPSLHPSLSLPPFLDRSLPRSIPPAIPSPSPAPLSLDLFRDHVGNRPRPSPSKSWWRQLAVVRATMDPSRPDIAPRSIPMMMLENTPRPASQDTRRHNSPSNEMTWKVQEGSIVCKDGPGR
jgi:hypothetical protein